MMFLGVPQRLAGVRVSLIGEQKKMQHFLSDSRIIIHIITFLHLNNINILILLLEITNKIHFISIVSIIIDIILLYKV